ncbi:MAG: M56 family metallopeptidase, partial [Alistipes sp.]|nr:M56 family metallopeptidase [Alistipes sp.]
MINFLFLKVLNMSITASVVILFVLAARFFLRRLPKIFSYLLWGIVVFRLVCPFSFTVPFSLLELTVPKTVENGEVIYISEDILYLGEPSGADGIFDGGDIGVPDLGEGLSEPGGRSEGVSAKTVISVMAYVWLFGIAAIAGYSILSFIGLKRKLVGAVKYDENVRITDHVRSSFVMGIFRPRIYLWSGLSKEEIGFVVAHEKTHIRRRDYLVKLFFWLVLMFHWFNPLVWLSYFLCMKDMEMSCDESVMKDLGEGARTGYSETLLSLAAGRKIFAGTPLFFGGGDTKSRIRNILSYRKPTMWALVIGIVVVVVLCVSYMGNPSGDFEVSQDNPETEETTENSRSYPPYPVYVRTMGSGSIGCEYGYCAVSDRDDERILAELGQMSGFYFRNGYSEDVALFYADEPREIKLYHAWEGSTEFEEYAFAKDGKYVIPAPKDYGIHYFFAVISWEDDSKDLLYFSVDHHYDPPSSVEYNMVQIVKNQTGETEVKYPTLHFP